MLIESLRLDGLLSFAPGAPALALRPLNVVIGPNGSGKSNLLGAIELLRAAPTALAAAVRDGGGVHEWLWKGAAPAPASLDVQLHRGSDAAALRYKLQLVASGARAEVADEAIEEAEYRDGYADHYFFYRYQNGRPTLNVRGSGKYKLRHLQRDQLSPYESVLSQRKDPELYPELSWCAAQFERIQVFRDWSFGRYAILRQPQPADLPTDFLLPDARNLGLILNQLEHLGAGAELNAALRRFLPRFVRTSTLVQGGTVQFFLHEDGLRTPIPATRLSDGTMRFLALCAILLAPHPPPLICLEEPELGLHPDAMAIIAELLVAASSRTQLIVTTHSDALVSALSDQPESLLICDYLDGTRLRRLQAQDVAEWLHSYRLGDLWRMGELGGNP